uniref:Uncharacterized protein n=1 Tax=Arundo donax TaxID=35708 RepID=A0A0A9G993_ARUDO
MIFFFIISLIITFSIIGSCCIITNLSTLLFINFINPALLSY